MALTKRQADPFCAKTPMKEEEVVVGAGGGAEERGRAHHQGRSRAATTRPPRAAIVDQSACMYRPRVQGIVLGQPLQIKNSDQTLHNVHGYKGPSTLFNQAEIPGMPPMTKQLTDADEILKFKCDVHPWMTGYVLVSSQPVLRGHRRRRQLQDHRRSRPAATRSRRGTSATAQRLRRSPSPRTSRPKPRSSSPSALERGGKG